ncbi:hypothetical protein FDECE_16203 [Fusarium decemcellulare]|nr:hypothetical protein FDECE_16203 [Fusarium decemcellulare]
MNTTGTYQVLQQLRSLFQMHCLVLIILYATEDDIRESNGILNSIAEWTKEKAEMIDFAYNTAGGWEGWAQVELAARLFRDHGAHYGLNQQNMVRREEKIYASSDKKADIALYRNGKPTDGAYIFELKYESSGNSGKFQAGLEDDMDKVKTDLKPDFKNAVIWVIGLDISKKNNLDTGLSAKGFKKYQPAGGFGEVRIWWWKK